MAAALPRLRSDLDITPSPLPDQPGLLIRDPFRYSDTTLVIPPLLARGLACFDGEHDVGDLRATLARVARQVIVGNVARQLAAALADAGFLEDDGFAALRAARELAFAALPERPAAHAGSGYPDDPDELAATLRGYLDGAAPAKKARRAAAADAVLGIAAPHASPYGSQACYARAYHALPADHADRVFVVLGTSHYGEPDRFGLTRKPFATPFGSAQADVALADELAAAGRGAVIEEDYCHAIEHAIEFQIVFLQHLYGARVRVLPILCGPFVAGPAAGRLPEADPAVRRFIGALGEMAAREGARLSFVLGVDFAHVGRRYGDAAAARAHAGAMVDVAARDRARVDRVLAGDAEGFWSRLYERGDDDLRWCGSSPLYTFLRAVPAARGRLLGYDHWNIDDASVVSFGAITFERGA